MPPRIKKEAKRDRSESKADDLICPICTELVVDASQMTCCGALFCRACITPVLPQCPMCRAACGPAQPYPPRPCAGRGPTLTDTRDNVVKDEEVDPTDEISDLQKQVSDRDAAISGQACMMATYALAQQAKNNEVFSIVFMDPSLALNALLKVTNRGTVGEKFKRAHAAAGLFLRYSSKG